MKNNRHMLATVLDMLSIIVGFTIWILMFVFSIFVPGDLNPEELASEDVLYESYVNQHMTTTKAGMKFCPNCGAKL